MAALKVLKTYAIIFDNSVKLFTELWWFSINDNCSKKLYIKFIMVIVPQISTYGNHWDDALTYNTRDLVRNEQVTVDNRRTAAEAISTSSCNVRFWDQMGYPLGIFRYTKIFLENVSKEHFIIKYTI